MRLIFLTLGLIIALGSCQNDENEGTHKIVVKEVSQTSNYTYLFGEESGKDIWLAVSKMNAAVGDTYYYEGGMLMQNFVSKELNKTFEEIYFLDAVRTTPEVPVKNKNTVAPHNMKPKTEKQELTIPLAEGGITIGELFSKKSEFEGKTVKVKGIVTKFNPEIMQKNWIHLQDGTEHEGAFDLTVTSKSSVKVGDTILVEGKISLNKDFGAGYTYEIIMEDAEIK